MGWPNVSIRLEFLRTTAAELTPYINLFAPNASFSAADWIGYPALIPGTIYNSFNDFETAWFTANVGATNQVSMFDGGLGTYPVGSTLAWSTPYALGEIQAQIEFQAASSLQTPEQWLAAQDATYRGYWGLAAVPGSYCFEYNNQNILITNGVDSEDTMGFEGIAWSFEDPPGTVWDTCSPMAIMFITIEPDGVYQPPMHSISLNQTGGMSENQSPYEKDKPKGTAT